MGYVPLWPGCLTYVLPLSLLNHQDCCLTEEGPEFKVLAPQSMSRKHIPGWRLTHGFEGRVLTLVIH